MGSEEIARRQATPSPAREDVENATGISAKALAAIDGASDGDRAWFARHADRSYRLRPYVPGEFPGSDHPVGTERLTLVNQITIGFRTRLPLWAIRRPCPCDACLGEIWDAATLPRIKRSMVDMVASLLATRP